MRKTSIFTILFALLLLTVGCRQEQKPVEQQSESREAKALLQGIWVDSETDDVVFKVVGDTVFYPDSTSQPAYFKIVDDTLTLGPARYAIEKQGEHLFWFRNQTGDLIKLAKSDDPLMAQAFSNKRAQILTVTEVLKRDTVVLFGGERYHCYIAINPTKYRVVKPTYNDDGVAVDNIYYDNIVHISVFHGARKLFSSDIKKQMFAQKVPAAFLEQAILGNMEFDKVDSRGFHFDATVCIPDGASCYLVGTLVSFDGKLSLELLEY